MNIYKKTPQLLCEKYWNKQRKITKNKSSKSTTIKDHRYVINLNGCLLSYKPLKHVDFSDFISVDNDFKHLPKLKNDIVLWRGIPKYHPIFESYFKAIYNKIETLKKGDILVNRSYIFGAHDRNIAEVYRHNLYEEGLLLKMNIKKGAQVSLTDFEGIMPRYSKWICLDKKEIKNGYMVELDYILPDEKMKNNYFRIGITNFINNIKNIFKCSKK